MTNRRGFLTPKPSNLVLRISWHSALSCVLWLAVAGCQPVDRQSMVQLEAGSKQSEGVEEHEHHEHFPEHWPEDIMRANQRISELIEDPSSSSQGISKSMELADLVGWLPILAADSDLGREDFARIDAWSGLWGPKLRQHASRADGLDGFGNIEQLTQMSRDLGEICRAEQARIDALVRRYSE
jgi:hypothetical protein